MSTEQKHLASEDVWLRYPGAGDPYPPGGTKVLLLTKGGILIVGQWPSDSFFTAWSPLPKRNREKEALL
jgi:hypothetical protein